MRLSLIGTFSATTDDGEPVRTPPNGGRLLALLALHRHGLTRCCAAGILWPEKSEDRASANLRSTLWRLKNTRSIAITDREPAVLCLNPRVRVDLDGTDDPLGSECPGDLTVDQLLGDLLEDWDDDWIEPFRLRWRQTRLHKLDLRCERLVDYEDYDEAVTLARRVLAVEPLRESMLRLLVRAELRRGRPTAAAEVINGYRTRLDQEYGASISPRMIDLVVTTLHASAVERAM